MEILHSRVFWRIWLFFAMLTLDILVLLLGREMIMSHPGLSHVWSDSAAPCWWA